MSGARRGAIELRGVTKQYGRERVVDAVSARILPGEFFSLLGPSGSGKTTTLMMIAGFAAVDEGAVLVDGEDLSATPPQRRGFGMVFQNYAIFPHLNVYENVAFPLRARKLPEPEIRSRVDAALELVRLERFADRFSRQLSGGQQQRVAIARAIVFHPSVVLMDEPLGALDKNLRYQMQVEIKQIQQRLGMTVVYVTHDQEEAMNMSDRIAIMNNGRIEQVGRPADIYENPATTFIARFLGEANLVAGTAGEAGDGIVALHAAAGPTLRARATQPVASGAAAHLFVRPERIILAACGGGTADHGGRHGTSEGAGADAGGVAGAGAETGAQSTAHPATRADPAAVNHLRGRIAATSFLGNMLRHTVEVPAAPGLALTVDVQNAQGGAPAAGAEVELSWRVADSVLLAD